MLLLVGRDDMDKRREKLLKTIEEDCLNGLEEIKIRQRLEEIKKRQQSQ